MSSGALQRSPGTTSPAGTPSMFNLLVMVANCMIKSEERLSALFRKDMFLLQLLLPDEDTWGRHANFSNLPWAGSQSDEPKNDDI